MNLPEMSIIILLLTITFGDTHFTNSSLKLGLSTNSPLQCPTNVNRSDGIPPIECSNNTTVNNKTSHTGNKTVDINDLSMNQICGLIGVPPAVCKCPGIDALVPGICDIYKEKNTPIKFVCGDNKEDLIKPIMTIFMTILSVFGNTLVILVAKNRWKTSPLSSKLIGALSFSDCIFSLLTFIDRLPYMWTCKWVFGRGLCKIIRPTISMSSSISLGFILIISIERYFGIVHPLNRMVTRKTIFLMCGLNILVSFLLVVPQAYALDINELPICYEMWSKQSYTIAYSWIMLVLTFILPVSVILTLYLQIVYSVRASQKHAAKSFSASQLSTRRSEDNRITAIIASLLAAFVVLVLPNRIVWILKDYEVISRSDDGNIGLAIDLVTEFPYMLHAVINPIIYSIVDRNFRNHLKKMFLMTCKRDVNVMRKGSILHTSNVTITEGL